MPTRYIVFKPTEINNYPSNGRYMQSQDYIKFDGDFLGTRRVVSSITISSQYLSAYLDTDANPSTPYVPQYPGSPATKKYVDDSISTTVASAYKYKGSVASYSNLPSTGLTSGDVYNVTDTGMNYAWTGSAWDALGATVDLSNYIAKDNTTAFTPSGDYNPATKKYVDDSVSGTISKGSTAPSSPVEGQLWYDTTNDVLKVYDGTQWKNVDTDTQNNWIDVNVATAYGTVAKVGTTTAGNYTPTKGDFLLVNFVNGCSINNPTLNIDGSGAKSIKTGFANATIDTLALGTTTDSNVKALFYYDGTYYRCWSTTNSNTTYSAMSVSEGQAGTATNQRSMRADYLKQIIKYHAVDDTAYGSTWSGEDDIAPSKKAVYNKIESLSSSIPTSSATAPANPTEGQLWYDTANDVLKSYNGTAWVEVGLGIKNNTTGTTYTLQEEWVGEESQFNQLSNFGNIIYNVIE